MSLNKPGYFTPIYRDNSGFYGKVVNFSESYLNLGGRSFKVMGSKQHNKDLLVKENASTANKAVAFMVNLLKVISYATVIFPTIALIVKASYRKNKTFQAVAIPLPPVSTPPVKKPDTNPLPPAKPAQPVKDKTPVTEATHPADEVASGKEEVIAAAEPQEQLKEPPEPIEEIINEDDNASDLQLQEATKQPEAPASQSLLKPKTGEESLLDNLEMLPEGLADYLGTMIDSTALKKPLFGFADQAAAAGYGHISPDLFYAMTHPQPIKVSTPPPTPEITPLQSKAVTVVTTHGQQYPEFVMDPAFVLKHLGLNISMLKPEVVVPKQPPAVQVWDEESQEFLKPLSEPSTYISTASSAPTLAGKLVSSLKVQSAEVFYELYQIVKIMKHLDVLVKKGTITPKMVKQMMAVYFVSRAKNLFPAVAQGMASSQPAIVAAPGMSTAPATGLTTLSTPVQQPKQSFWGLLAEHKLCLNTILASLGAFGIGYGAYKLFKK